MTPDRGRYHFPQTFPPRPSTAFFVFMNRLRASSLYLFAGFLLCASTLTTFAQRKQNRDAENDSLLQTNFPFQGACISAGWPSNNIAMKGLAIRLSTNASVLFDTELVKVSAGWTGRYITTTGVAFDGAHGQHPRINGDQIFGSRALPGWADATGEFADHRPEKPFGPLPAGHARFDGLYVNGSSVVLACTVLGTKIYEKPGVVEQGGQAAFIRTFQIEKSTAPLKLLVCDLEGAQGSASGGSATLEKGEEQTIVSLVGAPDNSKLEVASEDSIVLKLPKGAAGTFSVVIWRGAKADAGKLAGLLAFTPEMGGFLQGGPAHFPETVVTKGVLETGKTADGAYVTDALTPPFENPWHRRVRFGGMDFFSDGKRAALCTHDGDIWIVSGIDEGLEHLTWKRFASGMYETLGLCIVDDVIYTSGRDQITRYYDLNHDGEADYYENYCNLYTSSQGFHEFVFDLQRDGQGNFYLAKAGPVRSGGPGFGDQGGHIANGTITSFAGSLMKVSDGGRRVEVLATGFRAPNGIGVREDGQVVTSDNEGTWVPSTPINWIKPGGFYGVEPTAHREDKTFHPPLTWLSHRDYDNSGGGQVWVTSKRWGPFDRELLHLSYGKCRLFLVMKEEAGGLMQGGVLPFNGLRFTSSCMRGRFNPADGQLYIAGLAEWQTTASKPAGFDRVRYTGKPVYSASGLNVLKDGIRVTFTQPLDKASAEDLQNWSGKRWNYERAEHYGSPEFSVADPSKRERDTLNITSARLSSDGLTVTLGIEDFKPVMQESITYHLKAQDGTEFGQDFQHTVNVVPQ